MVRALRIQRNKRLQRHLRVLRVVRMERVDWSERVLRNFWLQRSLRVLRVERVVWMDRAERILWHQWIFGTWTSGYSGWSGWSAPSGFSGWSGWSGWTGLSGYSGASGYSGISGASGFSGWSGWTGLSGYSGTSGWSGPSGYSGWSGWSGWTGKSGYSGISGYSGTSGFSGWSGYGPTLYASLAVGSLSASGPVSVDAIVAQSPHNVFQDGWASAASNVGGGPGLYKAFRGSYNACWAYSENHYVVWYTPSMFSAPMGHTYVFAYAHANANIYPVEVYINDALKFTFSNFGAEMSAGHAACLFHGSGGYDLTFISKWIETDRFGVAYLTIPSGDLTTPKTKIGFRRTGSTSSWIMLHQFPDMLSWERVGDIHAISAASIDATYLKAGVYSVTSGQAASLTVGNFWASQIGTPNISINTAGDIIGYADRAWYCPNYIFAGGGIHISLTGSTRGIHWSGSNADWWIRCAIDASGSASGGDLELYGTSQCVRSYRPIVANQTVWGWSGFIANMYAIAPAGVFGVLNFESSGTGSYFLNSGGSAISWFMYSGSTTGNKVKFVPGIVGSAMSFCGEDDLIRSTPVGMSGASVFTFAGWLYWNRTGGATYQMLMGDGLEGTSPFWYMALNQGNSGLKIQVAASNYAYGMGFSIGNVFRESEWHHYIIVAHVYQNGYLAAWRDGAYVGSVAISHASGVQTGTVANYLVLGNYATEYNAGWSGMMDEVMLWGDAVPTGELIEQISPYPRRDALNDVVWQLKNPAHSVVFRNDISCTSVYASMVSGASYQNSPKFPTTLHSAGISIAAGTAALASFTISPLAGYSGLMPMMIYYAFVADVGSTDDGSCTCYARLSNGTVITLDTRTGATATTSIGANTIIASIGTRAGLWVKDIILMAAGSDDGTSKIYSGSIQAYQF